MPMERAICQQHCRENFGKFTKVYSSFEGQHKGLSCEAEVVEAVLTTVSRPYYSLFFLTDGTTSASTVFYLSQFSSSATIVVITDNTDFLHSFFELSLKHRVLVWSTRLLVVTRLPLQQLQLHYSAFSKMNAMLLIITDGPTIIRCNMYVHLPFSPQGTEPLLVASWTPVRGIVSHSILPLFPEKFSRFVHGPNLLAATDVNPFNKIILSDDSDTPGGRKFKFKGPVPEVMNYLAKGLNFSYTNVRPPDGVWGSKQDDGSWNGMVGMVMREEVSIGVGPFILSEDRAEVVDFTVAILVDYWKILGARGLPEVDPWGFLFPLAPMVWAAVLVALVVLPGSVFCMSSSFFHDFHGQGNWLQVTFGYIRILLQQDMTTPAIWEWERVILIMWMMVTLVLTRSYSGNLMALLAVRHISEPYQTRRQVLDDPSVTMIWLKGSAVGEYLHSVETGIYREIADAEQVGRLMWGTHAQFAGYINTLVRRGDHVLMEDDNGLRTYIAQDFTKTGRCSFYLSREEFLPLIFGMIGGKGNPIIPALNNRIMSMTEAGLFFQWLKMDEPNITTCYHAPTKITVKTALSLSNTWGMFVVLVAGYVISLLVLCIELRVSNIQHSV
ncbi:probable glutamate receptor [Cherax quadricarinatus]|uniref:probable glutamate receptor n=1 Tax=Cherax quadricarinatus TaxID=27406 RepID=UPI00387ECCA2